MEAMRDMAEFPSSAGGESLALLAGSRAADVVADDDRDLAAADPAVHGLVEVGRRKFVQKVLWKFAAAPRGLVAAGRRAGIWGTRVRVEQRHVAAGIGLGG